MKRLTLYTTLITGQLALAPATFLLQAQPKISDTEYLKIWNSLSTAEKTDAVAMIDNAPKGTTNTFDYYKNLINRNAGDIPSAIKSTGEKVETSPDIADNSIYRQLTRARQTIEADAKDVYSLIDSITRAEDILTKDTPHEQQSTLNGTVLHAMHLIGGVPLQNRNLQFAIQVLLFTIGTDDDFSEKDTAYDKLALALEKLNEKTGKPKPTIAQALDELDKMSFGECEQHKELVDARSSTKTLQEAINAVNGQPKHATNKTYGLLGNLKKTATANGEPLAEDDIYGRLKKGIDHLNTLLDARVSEWPDPHPENIGAIISHLS